MGPTLTRYVKHIGKQFGGLTFVAFSDERGDRNRVLGLFRCECGNVKTLALARVVKQQIVKAHCGCKTDLSMINRKHGMHGSSTYRSWQAMKSRCLDPNSKDYARYGAIGITVCESWVNSFEAFYAALGQRPEGTSLDRINNNLGYVPGNVRWATASEQQRNKRGAYHWLVFGQWFETLDDAAKHFGVTKQSVRRWVFGSFDARRGTFTAPKEKCDAIARY